MSLLSLQNVSKTFKTSSGPVHAVRNVYFEMRQGECLAIVGESGSGKTTLANMVLGVLAPSDGALSFKGRPLNAKRQSQDRRAIQLVQQNPLSALNPKRSVGASIRLGLDTYGIGERAARRSMVEKALEAVGLPARMFAHAPSALSGGQRQRVGIARALAVDPELLVLDEPTSALDVLVQARILSLLNKLRRDRGLAYIFITHDLSIVRNIADRVAVFQAGRLVELQETERIFTSPRSSYTRSLIGAVPVVDADELRLRTRLAEGA